jgi:hypothetical protein
MWNGITKMVVNIVISAVILFGAIGLVLLCYWLDVVKGWVENLDGIAMFFGLIALIDVIAWLGIGAVQGICWIIVLLGGSL